MQLLDDLLHDRLLQVDLLVLELPFNHLLGKERLLDLGLFQCQPYLGLGTGGLHHRQPLLLGLLIRGRHDFHLIAGT